MAKLWLGIWKESVVLKSTILGANIRFFDNIPMVAALERRFSRFLRHLREQRDTAPRIEAKAGRKKRSNCSQALFQPKTR
jgi:hypothetical protein